MIKVNQRMIRNIFAAQLLLVCYIVCTLWRITRAQTPSPNNTITSAVQGPNTLPNGMMYDATNKVLLLTSNSTDKII